MLVRDVGILLALVGVATWAGTLISKIHALRGEIKQTDSQIKELKRHRISTQDAASSLG